MPTSWSTRCTTRAPSTRTRSAPSSEAAQLAERARRRGPRGRRRRGHHRRPGRARSASTARRRSSASRAPRASPSRSSTRWPSSFDDGGHDYALFGGGLLGFEIGAGLAARLDAGVTMEVTQVNVDDGKLVAERPILGDSSISTSRYKDDGHHHRPPERVRGQGVRRRRRRGRGRHGRALAAGRAGRRWSSAASSAAPTSTSRTPTSSSPAAAGSARPRASSSARSSPRRFGGAVAATRAVVDAGWYPYAGADRPDGQDRRAEAVPRGGHLRRDPAQGRHAVLGEHRGDQQGLERPDLRVLATSASSATSTRSCPSSPRP